MPLITNVAISLAVDSIKSVVMKSLAVSNYQSHILCIALNIS